jgi:hypothetical protein
VVQPATAVVRLPGVQRWVDQHGLISLAGFRYRVPILLAGEPVEAVAAEHLVRIFHREVLVAEHVQRRKPDTGRDRPEPLRQGSRRPRRPTDGMTVTRVVDSSGYVSFAGTRVGNHWRGRSAQVAIVADSVQLSIDGRIVRVHPIRHDRAKEHGAFATPNGRPRQPQDAPAGAGVKATPLCGRPAGRALTRPLNPALLAAARNHSTRRTMLIMSGTGTNSSSGWWNLTCRPGTRSRALPRRRSQRSALASTRGGVVRSASAMGRRHRRELACGRPSFASAWTPTCFGLARILVQVRNDRTHWGDPGGTLHRRTRSPCPIGSPGVKDDLCFPQVAALDWLIITRDTKIAANRAEIAACV